MIMIFILAINTLFIHFLYDLAGGALLGPPCPEKDDLDGITLFFGFSFIGYLATICTNLGS